MSNKNAKIIIGLILVLVVGLVVYAKKQSRMDQDNGTSAGSESVMPGSGSSSDYMTEPPPPPSPASASSITLIEVAKHGGKSSCWSAINGSVYDLTSWIPNHPGGEQAILAICGKDGSGFFNAQHGSSAQVKAVLTGFKIGTLK